ncbi:MAG TPA: MFS transporter, partial [Geminicoccus sp.]|uniref:MFS transporter n=1 Tax=Geminicoccus sp. TaxID=2024832 RepID=UPI002E4683BA|nr:MFS transporter [Geminicoccus sp.]
MTAPSPKAAGPAIGTGSLVQPDKRAILLTAILGSSLAFIDGSVVNVALPGIQQSLNASPTEAQWIVNAYLLMLGALVLMGGSAGDRYGRRHVFLLGVAAFAVASIACAEASDARLLILARAG